MSPLLKKLNYKGQKEVVLLNLPAELELLKNDFEEENAHVHTKMVKGKADFLMAFCTKQAEVDATARQVLPGIEGDALVWLVYPKGSSKKYKADFNRDNGWTVIGQLGFEPVRQVAVDDDWSALRFKRVENIKTMTRSFALTEEGKARTKGKQ